MLHKLLLNYGKWKNNGSGDSDDDDNDYDNED